MKLSIRTMTAVLACAGVFMMPAAQGLAGGKKGEKCDNRVLRGVYNANCVGFIEEIQARFNSVATSTFHGDGTWEGVDVQKIQGLPFIIRTSFCGTYEVADNCELHIEFLNGANLPDVANCDSISPEQDPLATFDGGVFGLRKRLAEGFTSINTGFIDANGDPAIGNTSCTSRATGVIRDDGDDDSSD